MKHAFQNLNLNSKSKESMISLDSFEEDVGEYLISCQNLKQVYHTYHTKYAKLEETLNDLVNENVYYSDDLEKLNTLLDAIFKSGLIGLKKSKDWKALLDLIEGGHASKLQKEQKDLDTFFDAFQFTIRNSLGIIKDLHKKAS